MKLMGWQLVVVIVALLALVGALGWHGILDAKSMGLVVAGIVAWLLPSPAGTKTVGATVPPPPPVVTEKVQ